MDTVTGNQNRRRRNWSSLNYDLTDHIFRKYLPFSDLLRCRNVCRSWRSVSRTILSSFPVNSPVLVIPKLYLPQKIITCDEESCHFFFRTYYSNQCCFFNPVACKLYPLSEKSIQLLNGKFFLGLSKGWALFNGVEDLVLYNAPTGVCIRMPCPAIASIPIKKAFFWGGDPILDTKSKSNSSSSHGIVAIKDGNPINIYFSTWGDTTTKHTFQGFLYPYDVIYFNGLVYGVFGKGSFRSWDPNQGCTSTKVEPYMPTFNPGKRLRKLRLVDSSGELWLVSKFRIGNNNKIGVCKMDFKERKWVEMDSLGDQVVFMCNNQTIAFSPLSPSEYKRNCVYFEDFDGTPSKHRCIYVYNLEDGSAAKVFLCKSVLIEHDWYVPRTC